MCILRVSGARFDVVRYLATSKLSPYRVFKQGEAVHPSNPERGLHEESGFMVQVSDGSWSDIREQVRDAVAFLKKFRTDLARCHSSRTVQDMRLDFPVNLRIDRETVMAQFDYFPPELVSLAGRLGLGLELSIYPPDLEQLAQARKRARDRLERLAKKAKPKR